MAVLLILSVPMAELWREYLVAMGNLRIGSDYALGSLPLLAVPAVAWVSRTRRDRGMEWRLPAALDTRIRGRHRIGVDSGTPVDPRQNPEHDFRVVDNPDAMRRDFEPSSIESEET